VNDQQHQADTLYSVAQDGVLGSPYKTGRKTTLSYTRNKESSKGMAPPGMDFGQNLEPAGEYMVVGDGLIDSDFWESGSITFKNPIVLEFKSTPSDRDWETTENANTWGFEPIEMEYELL